MRNVGLADTLPSPSSFGFVVPRTFYGQSQVRAKHVGEEAVQANAMQPLLD